MTEHNLVCPNCGNDEREEFTNWDEDAQEYTDDDNWICVRCRHHVVVEKGE